MMSPRSLVIIGGGPAGMATAIEAARAGLSCTLIDEAPRLGGQIYQQPPSTFEVLDARPLGEDFLRGERLRSEFAEVVDRVEVLSGISVQGIWGREILWSSDEAAGIIHAERLIIATGAYDRPVPFPGWTLPGVLTAGGAQALIKTMRIRPGRRAIVAGTGPFLLVAANQLHEIGVEVVMVLEAGEPWSPRALPKEWDLVEDAEDDSERLRGAGIPLLFNHTIFEAHGRDSVEGVSYGPVDAGDWRPLRNRARMVEADLLVVGFGFVPRAELTEIAGSHQQYVDELGGWVPVRDEFMQTTVPGVFAVGDCAGVAGDVAAMEEGRVAGITAAEQAGAISADEADRRRSAPLGRLRSLAEVRQALGEAYRIRPGLSALATSETLVCRCEEVPLAAVEWALEEGARDLQAIKLLTRLGMGLCQGRYCAPSMAAYLAHALGQTPDAVGRVNPRPPVTPVPLGALARLEGAATDPSGAIDQGGGS